MWDVGSAEASWVSCGRPLWLPGTHSPAPASFSLPHIRTTTFLSLGSLQGPDDSAAVTAEHSSASEDGGAGLETAVRMLAEEAGNA